MKRKVIESGQALLVILLNHLAMIGFCMTVMGLFGQENHYMWLWCTLLIVPVVFYFARVKLGNFFLFFALHLAVPFMVLFLPVWILPKIILFAVVVMYVIWSINIRLKGKLMGEGILVPLFVISALGIMTLIENLHSKMRWERIYLGLAITYVAGYFLCCFIDQYFDFLTVNESSAANIPEQEIFSSGMRQTVLFMAGSIVVLLLTANIGWVSYILSWLGKGLLAVLRFLFSGAANEETEEMQPYVTEQVQKTEDIFADKGETGFFWVLLEKIILTAVVLLLIGLVVFGIVAGFKYLWKYFHAKSVQDKEKLQTGIDIRETCAIERGRRESAGWFSFLNHREKIRKMYRKQVLKHKADIIGEYNLENLEYMTARECCDKMSNDSKISATNLKKIYEKARYSAEEITAEDVRLLKSSGKS